MTLAITAWKVLKSQTTIADGATSTIAQLSDPGNGKCVLFLAECIWYEVSTPLSGTKWFAGGYRSAGGIGSFFGSGTVSPQTHVNSLQQGTFGSSWSLDATNGSLQVKCANTSGVTVTVGVVLRYVLVSD